MERFERQAACLEPHAPPRRERRRRAPDPPGAGARCSAKSTWNTGCRPGSRSGCRRSASSEKGKVLVLEGREDVAADRGQVRDEGRIARQAGPQDQRVDEAANHRGEIRQGPAVDRRADDQILLAAVAMKQHLEAGQQEHVERGSPRRRQGAQTARRGSTDCQRAGPRPVAGLWRPWAVGREAKHLGRIAKVPAPERGEANPARPGHHAVLPVREVAATHGGGADGSGAPAPAGPRSCPSSRVRISSDQKSQTRWWNTTSRTGSPSFLEKSRTRQRGPRSRSNGW